jgi:hypothetical protein
MQIHAPILAAAESIRATKFRSTFSTASFIAGKPVGSNPGEMRKNGSLSPRKWGVHRPETTKQQFP